MNNEHINNTFKKLNTMMKVKFDSLHDTDAIIMHQTGKTQVLKRTDGMQVMIQRNTDDGYGRIIAGVNLSGLIDKVVNNN